MTLSETIIENFEKFNTYFDLGLRQTNRSYVGCCPIHDGDNSSALTIYTNGYNTVGVWRCFTGDCHRKYGANAVGFVRGLLSRKYKRDFEFSETIKWVEEFLGSKIEIKQRSTDDSLTHTINRLSVKTPPPAFQLKPAEFISKLAKPTYFIERGYAEKTLEKFHIGLCDNPTKPMYNRIIVPQFDVAGEFIIGALGRSIFEVCEICKGYHDPNSYCRKSPKWWNTPQFPSEHALYNFHRAKQFINETGIAILIESAGDTWRLDEADFPMALGCFGSKFSDLQKTLLDTTAATTVVVVPNTGKAGQIIVEHVKERCKLTHNIVIIEPNYSDDVGNCNVETVKKLLGPIVDKYNGY